MDLSRAQLFQGDILLPLYFRGHENLPKIAQQRGAAEARRAHNPEDTGSKPVVAKLFFLFLEGKVMHASGSLSANRSHEFLLRYPDRPEKNDLWKFEGCCQGL